MIESEERIGSEHLKTPVGGDASFGKYNLLSIEQLLALLGPLVPWDPIEAPLDPCQGWTPRRGGTGMSKQDMIRVLEARGAKAAAKAAAKQRPRQRPRQRSSRGADALLSWDKLSD